MRKRFTESRTYEQAQAIAERRIADAIEIYDVYKRKEENEHRKYFIERPCLFVGRESIEQRKNFMIDMEWRDAGDAIHYM